MPTFLRPASWYIVLLVTVVASLGNFSEGFADDGRSTHFYLVGVGPGDADLMTLRAAKTIEKAEIVLCRQDHAKVLGAYLQGKEVHSEFSGMIPFYSRDPSQYEGEERKRAEQYQDKRAKLVRLVREAVQAGKTVAALDNGDPMIYGPNTWMLQEFEDLNPQVIPGLSSFNAANAALKANITSGGHTKSVTLSAGDWIKGYDTIEKLSVHRNTMVLFTMRAEFKHFIEKLSINYPPDTPIAIVQQAGQVENEKIIRSTLGKIQSDVSEEDLPFEYLIYIGDFLR